MNSKNIDNIKRIMDSLDKTLQKISKQPEQLIARNIGKYLATPTHRLEQKLLDNITKLFIKFHNQTKNSQANEVKSNKNIHIVMNVNAIDAASFKQSKAQIISELGQILRNAK